MSSWEPDDAFATALVLQYGPPPKSLVWRSAGFAKKDTKAKAYCMVVDREVRRAWGQVGLTPTKTVILRNKVLRKIFTSMGIPQK